METVMLTVSSLIRPTALQSRLSVPMSKILLDSHRFVNDDNEGKNAVKILFQSYPVVV